jgi:hypothetical protein
MSKRSGKFYRNNEKEVMRSLGLEPTPNSGSGWIVKEDGQSEEIICQLKSTDANSIKVNKSDLDTLEYNSLVSHKLPVFVIQFLQSNQSYLILKPEDLSDIVKYIKTGEISQDRFLGIEMVDVEDTQEKTQPRRMIGSSSKAREAFNKKNEEKYSKKVRKAR